MNTFVLDASMALSWLIEDEQTAATRPLLLRIERAPAHVPALWHWEVMNGLWMARRRGRFPAERWAPNLAAIESLPVETDPLVSFRIRGDVAALAQTHGLTIYDAAYLELALRKGMPLASLDKELCKAALREGVEVLGPLGPAGELREEAPPYGSASPGKAGGKKPATRKKRGHS